MFSLKKGTGRPACAGRHAGFRNLWEQSYGGSSPLPGTNPY